MANEYSINAKITADSTGFEKGIKSAQNSLKGFSSSISSAMKLAGGLFAIGSIAQLGKALSDMSQSYAKATQNIVRGTGAVGEQLKTLQKSVNTSLINGVGRDASELGEMVADLNTRLGVTGDTLTELVSQFDDFSDVTGTDTKTAINSVSDVLAKWNIETSQTVPLLDQLTAASQASGASVTELTNGLKSGQAVFSQFGMSATESIAFLGTLKKNGIDTSGAIMGMKTALANFAKSGLDAKMAFAEISESIKNAGTQTEALSIATQTFGQRNGAEFVKILSGGTDGVNAFAESLENAGGTLARTNEASRTSADALKDLKATIAGVFATSGTDNGLRDLIDDVAQAIRNLDFSSIKETFSNIGLFIRGVWEQIKKLFNNLSGAIDVTGGNFKIFADIIYDNLNSAYQVIQDLVGMVSAVLNGDWSVAWEYAKLIVLRTVKQIEESVNNAIKLMPNLFNSVIEGYNWVLEQQDKLFLDIFHLPEKYFKSAKLPKFEGKDLIDTKSIEEAIENVRKTIESKTGKIADKTLADLKRQKEAVHDTTQSVTSDIGSLGTAVENTTETTSTKVSDFFEEWGKQYEDLAGNWNKTFTDMANIGTQTMGDMFQQLGQDLANGGVSFENYSAVAVKAISQVLVALSAQITALGVTHALSLDFAGAALAAAGAAAALVAAGTLAAVATNMTKTAEAAKDASTSIDTFVKSLREIWSGTVTSGSFVTSLTTMKTTVNELKQGVEETSSILEEHERKLATFDKRYGTLGLAWKEAKRSVYDDYRETKKYVESFSDELDKLNTKLLLAQGELNNARMHTIENQEKEIELTKTEISIFEELYGSLKKIPKAIYGDVKYALQQNFDILLNEQKKSLLDVQKSLYTEMSNMGKDLGKTLVDGIKNGTKTADFMESIKDYIRNKIIELTVYTDSFNDKLAEIGAKLSSAIASGMTDEVKKLSSTIENLYKESTETAKKAVEAMGLSLKEEVKDSSGNDDVKKEFSAEGTTLGETFITSLISGAKKEDFSKTLGSYMKEQLIRATVYTEEFQKKMDVFGKKLVESAGKESVIKDLKKDIESLFSDKSKSIQNMTAYIDTLFELGEVATETESKFKIAMKSFKDSVIDLGAEVANNLVSSLSSGLNVDSALLGFKKFLRDYIIKAYVFTDSMKGEIEKIGSLIGKTLDGSISKKELSDVANAVKTTYGKLAGSMKTVDTLLDSVFGKELETKTTSSSNTVTENVSRIQKAIDNLKDSLKDLGGDVAGNFISSLNSGLDLDSALVSFKKFIRNYVIQSAVYTDSLKSEMEKIGKGIADYVSGKNKSTGLDKISDEFKKTYEKLAIDILKAEEYLDRIFGKEKEEEVKDTSNTITKELSKIESAMDSFKKTVADLGGDIASNLIDGLTNGLSQSDFLSNMKNWIKKMLVQSVVYTEQMKSQIEEIGKAISNAISGGFTETSMHEIRRDLSYIFEQATSKMSGIDKVLGGVFDGYASGTTSALSGLHIVGERGPELVRFNGGERVYNNADTMKMIAGAGKSNNFNVTFNNLQDTSAFAMMSQLRQYNREMAINGIL